jgi:signal transduction histidine kinase
MKENEPKGTKTASLRWRLTLVSLSLLTLALVALDAAIYIGLQQRVYRDLRAKIRVVNERARDYNPGPRDTLATIANTFTTFDPDVVAVIDRPGRYPVVGKSTGLQPPELPRVETRHELPDVAWSLFITAVNSDSDLMTGTLNYYPTSSDTVLFIASRKPVEASLRRLLTYELIGTILVLGLAVFIVGAAVRFTLRPLDRMAAVADSIAAGSINQRLRPSKTTTELGRLATALDAMLESLAASLISERSAHEKASQSEERMRDFLSDASHELRTPIAGLQWSAEALLRHGDERERRERLSFEIVQQARRATQLVADLLAMARLDQGIKLEQKPFDLGELAADEIKLVHEREPGLKVRLTNDGSCTLVADPERIRQVISNLLDNACKAMDRTGEIDVTVRRKGATAQLEVHDSGPGVPDDEREHIFERFVRLDSTRGSKRYGSGLGLAIARGFAEAHGGSLVCAKSDSGARFVLELPLSGRAERNEPSRAAQVF